MVKVKTKEQYESLVDLIIALEYLSTWCPADIFRQFSAPLKRVKLAFEYE